MFPMSGVGFMGRRQSGPITSGLLTLEFDDILNAPVADPTDVADWNTLFNLPALGTEFTSVTVAGDIVELFNPSTITLKGSIFSTNTFLIRFIDTDIITTLGAVDAVNVRHFLNNTALLECRMPVVDRINPATLQGCTSLLEAVFPEVLETFRSTAGNPMSGCTSMTYASLPKCKTLGNATFLGCTALASVDLPLVESIGPQAFQNTPLLASISLPECLSINTSAFLLSAANATMTSFSAPKCTTILASQVFRRRSGLTSINLAACTQLGATTGDDLIFANISGNTITFTLPVGTRTDGDAVALAAANTVTFLP